jgi:hypothetical protein
VRSRRFLKVRAASLSRSQQCRPGVHGHVTRHTSHVTRHPTTFSGREFNAACAHTSPACCAWSEAKYTREGAAAAAPAEVDGETVSPRKAAASARFMMLCQQECYVRAFEFLIVKDRWDRVPALAEAAADRNDARHRAQAQAVSLNVERRT